MFYCEECGNKRGWPTWMTGRSGGACELCRRHADCLDVPSDGLPSGALVTEGEARLLADIKGLCPRFHLDEDVRAGRAIYVAEILLRKPDGQTEAWVLSVPEGETSKVAFLAKCLEEVQSLRAKGFGDHHTMESLAQ